MQAVTVYLKNAAMPRDRQRATVESGPKLDLAKLIPPASAKGGVVKRVRCRAWSSDRHEPV